VQKNNNGASFLSKFFERLSGV